jgi:thiamine kinase-like enzyme
MGPYSSVAEFVKAQIMNKILIMGRQEYVCDGTYDKDILSYLLSVYDNIKDEDFNNKIVLCHNDLNMRNIMVKDNKITAIIDWEYAGFYPIDIDVYVLPCHFHSQIPDSELWINTITKLAGTMTDWKVLKYLHMLSSLSNDEQAVCPVCNLPIVKVDDRYKCSCVP